MPAHLIESLEVFEDENRTRLVGFLIRRDRRGRTPLKDMLTDGIEIAFGATAAALTWKSNFHPAWTLAFSAMGAVSTVNFLVNARRFIRKLPRVQKDRLRLSCYLATGMIIYCTGIDAFSLTLKSNDKLCIPCFGVAALGYYLSASSVTKLGRTILNRSPFTKCCQLLFGPALITSAAYYLLSIRQHDKVWLHVLPMIANAIVANHMSFVGKRRVESNNEPRWLLFKGLELFVAGCLLCINGNVLVIYAINNQFNPISIALYASMIWNGITDIKRALEKFQECAEMEGDVFYCICDMITGPILFLKAFVEVRFLEHPVVLSLFVVTTGIGLSVLGKGVLDLYDLVPQPVFKRYCQRVLGPVATVYSSLFASYICYSMGWRFSLVVMPFIPAGIYVTYQGFRRRNRPQ